MKFHIATFAARRKGVLARGRPVRAGLRLDTIKLWGIPVALKQRHSFRDVALRDNKIEIDASSVHEIRIGKPGQRGTLERDCRYSRGFKRATQPKHFSHVRKVVFR